MRIIFTFFKEIFLLLLFVASLFILLVASLTVYLTPQLPDVTKLNDYKLQTPLKIYSRDGLLITEYGEQRRAPLEFREIPENFVKALIAIEDNRFEYHKGMDPIGFARAAVGFISGAKSGGGSTLTQQVARNVFLNRKQTFTRKFSEILLALKMEALLDKEQIFELYVNKHFLGHRAYGIEAAANVYYGRNINQLTLPELAMLAGLHQSPSGKNPLSNPQGALKRRDLVLRRMFELEFISKASFDWAKAQPLSAKRRTQKVTLEALYAAEEVRATLYSELGDKLYSDGFHVFTTIDSKLQKNANTALRTGLLNYSERHGYRGASSRITINDEDKISDLITKIKTTNKVTPLQRALVLSTQGDDVKVLTENSQEITLNKEDWSWAAPMISVDSTGSKPESADFLIRGDIIYLRSTVDDKNNTRWKLSQPYSAQGAIISIDPYDGAIVAMSGGYNYSDSKFNRATQAKRQPGSNIKPFIYASAIEKGYSASTLINDAPLIFQDDKLETSWRPKNSGNKYLGEIPLRQALYQSRNASSVRLLDEISTDYALNYLERLGFDTRDFARDLSMILGTNELSPQEVAQGYALFANGGFQVTPYLINRIEDHHGNLIFQANPQVACKVCLPSQTQAPQVMDESTAFIMDSILKDVVTRGTATRAKSLNRNDIAGKTGTTNNQVDAWFSGYSPKLVTSTWVGFDTPLTLGRREYGGRAALPIWIDFMGKALEGLPQVPRSQPAGIVKVKIDPKNGLLATKEQENGRYEWFRSSNAPNTYSSRGNDIVIIKPLETPDPTIAVDDNTTINTDGANTEANEPSEPTVAPTPEIEIINSPDLIF
jgi:penicillin-binding protein 1A